ncbi:MAG: peptidoglycan recognition family protein [Capsulimonadaceae bacterium]
MIYTTSDWGARPAERSNFKIGDAQGIVIHHSDNQNRPPLEGDAEKEAAFARARQIQATHMDQNHWADSGQHFLVSRGGVIVEGRHGSLANAKNGRVVQGAHADSLQYNLHWFGIENEGTYLGDTVMPAAQWDALTQLCAWLSHWGGFQSEEIRGHRFVAPHGHTDCPGNLADRIAELIGNVHRLKLQIEQP